MDAALETLVARGHVPDDWLDAPVAKRAFARRSLCDRCSDGYVLAGIRTSRGGFVRVPCPRCRASLDGYAGHSRPETLDELIAMALDPRAIETAEALGREVFARIPDVDPVSPRVLWRFVACDRESSLLASRERDALSYFAADELGALSRSIRESVNRVRIAYGSVTMHALRTHGPAWLATAPGSALEDLDAAAVWRAASGARTGSDDPVSAWIDALSEAVKDDARRAMARNDNDLGELCKRESPFEAAIALWHLGVGIQAVTMQTIVLVLPVVRA